MPFEIAISKGDVLLQRDSGIATEPYADMQAQAMIMNSAVVQVATGDWNFSASLQGRLVQLRKDREATTNAENRAALDGRVRCLEQNGGFMGMMHGTRLIYAFKLSGSGSALDPDHLLKPSADFAIPWPIEFWLGGWDGDAMIGYVVGWLRVPQIAGSDAAQAQPASPRAPVDALEFNPRFAGEPKGPDSISKA